MFNLIKNRFSFCKNVIIAITLFCAINILPRVVAVVNEGKAEAQREGIQQVSLRENEINNVPDLYTQTQAHERLKKMRALIQDNFGKKVVPYFNIISRMVTKEAELKDTHYVFYHATPTIFTIMTDLFTQLHFYVHPEVKEPMDDTFRFLRFEGQSKNVSAREFVSEEMHTNFLIDDKDKKLQAILLSVNLSLFGSVGSQTESTWLRFIDNRRSLSKPEMIESMMDDFGLTKKYVKEIMALDNCFAVTPEAAMVQIFIPKKKVDELVYLAWIRGIPASGPIMEWIKEYQSSPAIPEKLPKLFKDENVRGSLEHISMSRDKLVEIFKKEQEKNPIYKKFMKELETGEFSAYAYLKAYCNTPNEVPYLNDTQGRILFTKEGLLNPSSDIKFYYYYSTPHEKIEEYTTKLDAIVQKIIAEKESRSGSSGAVPKATPAPVQKQKSAVMPKSTPAPVSKPGLAPMLKPVSKPTSGQRSNAPMPRQIPGQGQRPLRQIVRPVAK